MYSTVWVFSLNLNPNSRDRSIPVEALGSRSSGGLRRKTSPPRARASSTSHLGALGPARRTRTRPLLLTRHAVGASSRGIVPLARRVAAASIRSRRRGRRVRVSRRTTGSIRFLPPPRFFPPVLRAPPRSDARSKSLPSTNAGDDARDERGVDRGRREFRARAKVRPRDATVDPPVAAAPPTPRSIDDGSFFLRLVVVHPTRHPAHASPSFPPKTPLAIAAPRSSTAAPRWRRARTPRGRAAPSATDPPS